MTNYDDYKTERQKVMEELEQALDNLKAELAAAFGDSLMGRLLFRFLWWLSGVMAKYDN